MFFFGRSGGQWVGVALHHACIPSSVHAMRSFSQLLLLLSAQQQQQQQKTPISTCSACVHLAVSMSAQGKGDIWQSYHLSNLRMKYTSILYRLFLLFHFVRCCAAIARCGISFISMAHRAHRLLAYTHCVVHHQWQVQAAALHSQLANNHFVLYSHLRINPVSQFVQYRFLIAWHSSKNFRMNSKKKKNRMK